MQHQPVAVDSPTFDETEPSQGGLIASVADVLEHDEAPADRRLSVTEAAALAIGVAIGTLSLVSLAAAHLHHARPIVIWPVSLVILAFAGWAVSRWDRPTIRLDLAALVPVLLGAAIACVTMFPGFEYATGDRDPGAYVQHAVAIERTGSIDFTDDLLTNNLPTLNGPAMVWPAIWVEPGHTDKILPQFYHLWPALLATSKGVGGYTGLFDTGPLLGVLCVIFAVCIGRRIAGWPGAWTAAALLSTNMLQVWQAKYPSAEIFAQFLFLAATLAVVIAVQSGWRTGAAVGGAMIALTYLERPDGIVLVLIAWAALAALVAARRFDARARWFGIGLLALLPYGFVQAYHLTARYTLANRVPGLPKVLAVMIALAVLAIMIGWHGRAVGRLLEWSAGRRVRFGLSMAFVTLCAALMLVGLFRARLFGADYAGIWGQRARTYDEASLIRLSWFFSLFGLALLGAGIAFFALRKWRLEAWLVALPAVGLLTLYCYHVRNSPYLMWATRRFVPTVVPGMVLLIGAGVALVVLTLRRVLPAFVGALVAALMLVGLMTFDLRQSWPLHNHNENGSSVEIVDQIAGLAGGQKGIFLWEPASYCCAFPSQLFGGSLFTIADQSSASMPTDPAYTQYVLTTYLKYASSSGRPLFYIADQTHTPPPVPGMTATKVKQLAGFLPHWEETFVSRPNKTRNYSYDMSIYRLTSG